MTYMENRPYGKSEGLAERLLDHIHKLGTDKSLPWVGLGLIDDLRCASAVISGKSQYPEPEAWEIEAKKTLEFDL